MSEKLAQPAYMDSFTSLMLADDMAGNATVNKWKLALQMNMLKAVVYALWAIYFQLGGKTVSNKTVGGAKE